MAARWRRKKMLISVVNSNTSFVVKAENDKTDFEHRIFDIIDAITNRIALDIVKRDLELLIQDITTKAEALKQIDKIERLILSIIDNITNRTPLELVRIRLRHLRDLVEATPEFVEAYDEFNETILDIIKMITLKIDIPSIIKSIETLQLAIAEEKPEVELMAKIQRLILGIIDNIINRTPLEIVKIRLKHLRELVQELVAMDAAK